MELLFSLFPGDYAVQYGRVHAYLRCLSMAPLPKLRNGWGPVRGY